MTPPFHQKIALVTGASRGIGRAIALKLAQEGADLILTYFRQQEAAEAVAQEIAQLGRQAHIVKLHAGDPDDINRLFDTIGREFDGLDLLIHNAASGSNRPILQQKVRGWDWTLNTNARSLLLEAQRATPLLQKRGGGAIIAITSLGSQRVFPDYGVVGASKAAIEALVRYLAVELAPHNINVNAIAPGIVQTEALEQFSAYREAEGDVLAQLAQATPIGRLCTPEDVAEAVAFLASPRARAICGHTLVMDGGQSLLWHS